MTITNISARKVSLSIGGKDFTPCLISFQGSDSHLDGSGLISFTGTIILGAALGFDESLDDRKNTTRFCRGTTITLDIANSAGTLQRHPRGTLRVLRPKYDEYKEQQSLEVGDLIALLRFKEPTNSVEFDQYLVATVSPSGDGSTVYKDPVLDYVAGADRSLSLLLTTLLSRAGINSLAGSIPPIIYNNALNLSGSYLESAGKLLYANNRFGWIDKDEIFQVEAANISAGDGGISLQIGSDEIWYRRLDGSESPCEIIKAAGTGVYVYPTQFLDDGDEQYGDGGIIDPAFTGFTIVLTRTTKIQNWNKSSHILTITTTTLKPYGLVFPKKLQNSIAPKLSLIPAQIDVETFCYEDRLECKLKTRVIDTYQARASYFLEYQTAHPNTITDLFALWQTKSVHETYEYDVKDRLQKLTTKTLEAAIVILNGTNEDWTQWLSPPEYLVDSELKTEFYKEISKGTWEYRVTDFQCLVRVNSDLVTGPNGATSGNLTNKLRLISTTGNDDKRSNSGQLQPPAPERCPADVRYEETALIEKAQFATPCPSVLRPRERTYSVDFLAGQTVNVQPGSSASQAMLTTASSQLQALAQREGRLLWGRYKGQEIAAAISDAVFNYLPLLTIRATEQDGTVQYYLADGSNWVVSQTKALWSCDGIWVGTAQGGIVVPPYTEPQEVGFGAGAGVTFIAYPYLLTVTTEAIQFGVGSAIQLICGPLSVVEIGSGIGSGDWTQSVSSQEYWEDFSWDDADPTTWDNLLNSPTWDSVDWNNLDWDNAQ